MSNCLKKTYLLFCALVLLSLSACNISGNSAPVIAVIDANAIITTGIHAQEAATEINKAQEIYQYNLNVIIKKLAAYKNKEQAQAYLNSASKQLQAQLNASRDAVTQSLANVLNGVIAQEKNNYELILLKSNVIHASASIDITSLIQEKYDAKTINYPQLPIKIDNPNLPADMGKKVEKKADKKAKK